MRLLRLARLARGTFSLEGVRYAAALAVVTVLAGGAAFSSAEGEGVSTWDGVWWAITTMTTVGYGDLSPETNVGRVVAIVVMLVGIGFIAILTAALAERFVAHEVKEEVAEAEAEIVEQVEETQAALLGELRAITARLHELETRVQRGLR